MQTSQQKLQELLQQLFRADNADLDFGIYRIINYRRDQIQEFIDGELLARINKILDTNSETESAHREMGDLAQQISEILGDNVLDADGNLVNETYSETRLIQQYLETRERLGTPQSRYQRTDAIFNHLYTFFSRYYEDGDFIPRRRYSQTERYSIPYNGEEVYLHWANRDQYYVKSGDLFSTYRFKSLGITVTFDLRNVDVEKDNVQGTKRFFLPLSAEVIYSPETAKISIPFEYRPLTDEEKALYRKQKKQDEINETAETQILQHVSSDYNAYVALEKRIDQITVLKKHLDIYTRRNTSDFFIHKDLNQFLSHELDIYIKNKVIPLSDFILTSANLEWLETAQLVHHIATQIIDFLSQIEEFQKHLWLKKKFVLSTDYCLTLDRIPEELYPQIAQNTAQREEWKHLFAIHEIDGNLVNSGYDEPLSVAFLKENPNLVLDTRHFDEPFKDCLLAHVENLDNETDGLLIHGENFQSLNLLKEKYRGSVKAIYIDPPYNTDASAILYKNNYKDSSWLSLMADRITVSRELLTDNGSLCTAIDDVEASNLRHLLQHLFGKENELGIVAVCSNPGGRKRPKGIAPAHEYAMFFGASDGSQVGRLEWTEKQLESYNNVDEKKRLFKWRPLRKSGGPNARRAARPRLFYPIFVKDSCIRIPKIEWSNTTREWHLLEKPKLGETEVWPIDEKDEEMTWSFEVKTLKEMLALSEISAKTGRNGKISIQFKRLLNEEGTLPTTWWGKIEYSINEDEGDDWESRNTDQKKHSATAHGTGFLKNMLGDALSFPFPKSIYLVEDCLRVLSLSAADIVLDYFGGSGTTAHATINLNRQDNGKRRYILIEMGHHFDTVLKPRIMKAIYAEKWKDAKPVSRESRLSHIIKYQRIESYEDVLNNIEFTERENSLFEENLFSYLLGGETRESPTFLNVTELQNPFSYQLNIVNGLRTQTQAVDLPETFNYLLGVSVQTRQCFYDDERRYLVYRGTVREKTVIIIWRETKNWKEKDWERDYRFIEKNKLTEGASEVYVNTDSILPKAKSLDPLFKRLMFSQ